MRNLSRDEIDALRLMHHGVLRRSDEWAAPTGDIVVHDVIEDLKQKRLVSLSPCGRIAKLTYDGLLACEGLRQ